MKLRLAIAVLLLRWSSPVVASAQSFTSQDVNSVCISSSAYTDSAVNRVVGRIGLDLMKALPSRSVFSSSLSLVEDKDGLRAGRGFLRWESMSSEKSGSTATAGTFFYQPQIFENRAGNVYLPSVLVNGFQSQWHSGKVSIDGFAGRSAMEEGLRIMYVRSTSDRMAAITTTFNASSNLSFGFQAARTSANPQDESVVRAESVPASSLQLRQAAQWRLSQTTKVTGELGFAKVSGNTSKSYDAAVEHEGNRLHFRAAYVKRSADYLPFALLSFSSGRQGPFVEARYQVSNWLEIGGSAVKLRVGALESAQRNGNVTVQLPKSFQVTLARSESRYAQFQMSMQSVTLSNSFRRWITRVRVDEIALKSTARSRSRGIEFDATRLFTNGLSLSGEFRVQNNDDPARRITRVSTAVRGGYNFRRLSFNIQTDFGRDIRNETVFATSNLRTSTASLSVKVSKTSDLRFEYYGTRLNYELNPQSILASTLLGNSVVPVLGGSNRNVFYVQYQKMLRWGKSSTEDFAKSSTGLTIVRPAGTVGGRVFVDDNENGTWDEGERGVTNALIALNGQRKTATDDQGRFEFSGVPVGPSEVSLETETLSAVFTPTTVREPVTVVFKGRTQTAFALHATSSISGRIVEKNGDAVVPVAEAALRLEPGGLYAYTDAAGEFSISSVPQGHYELKLVGETIEHPTRIVSGPAGPSDISQSGQQLKNIDFVLEAVTSELQIERLPLSRILVKSTGNEN